jgi:hypothetical protein
VTAKYTIVREKRLADSGLYGMEKAVFILQAQKLKMVKP